MALSLIRHGANVNDLNGYWTPLTHAMADFPKFAHQLLNYGAKPNEPDVWGRSPLHVAVEYGLVRRLIKRGADVKARKGQGHPTLGKSSEIWILPP